LYIDLFELCIKNIEVPSSINNISYEIQDNEILSFTPIESILWLLSTCVENARKDFQGDFNTAILKTLFGNFFTLLDFLCSLKNVDLSLPAVSYEGNIAQKIIDEFEKQGYPLDIFSQNALAYIQFCIENNCNTNSRNEKKEIIHALVNLFLSNFSSMNNNPMRKILKKEREERDESNQKSNFFHKIEQTITIPTKVAEVITLLFWRFFKELKK
jgi:hypothetical protein